MNKTKKNTIFLLIAFFIFMYVTFLSSFNRMDMLFRDEAHAWTIAQYCSIPQLFDLMKYEGHMLLWYLVLMPFAKMQLWYPQIMLFFNWIFAVGAILLVVLNKKMNVFVKIFLMFCPVFTSMYAVYARCYSIGVFLLFLACALYKKRLEHPYLYFLILFLAANTSIMALAMAFPLGCLFLYDLYKEKLSDKDSLIQPILITIFASLTGLFLFFQFNGFVVPAYETALRDSSLYNNIIKLFFEFNKTSDIFMYFMLCFSRLFALLFLYFFANNLRVLFLFLFSTLSMSYLFLNFYSPYQWHLAFFIIYLFVCYWIYLEENTQVRTKVILTALMLSVLFVNYIYPSKINVDYDNLTNALISNNEFKTGKIYTFIPALYLSGELPILNNSGIHIYDFNNIDISSYEGLKRYYHYAKLDLDKFSQNLDKHKTNFIISSNDLYKDSKYNKINKRLYLKTQYYYIYKIILKP